MTSVAFITGASSGLGAVLARRLALRDRAQVRAAVAAVAEDLGPVDLMVANAGISIMTVPAALDAADVEDVMATNFFGALYATEAVLPAMLARGSGLPTAPLRGRVVRADSPGPCLRLVGVTRAP